MLAFSPDTLAPLITLLFTGALFAVIYSVKSHQDTIRTAAMNSLANDLGNSFSKNDQFGLALQLKQFELFKKGVSWLFNSARIRNVIKGNVGDTEVYLFDYSYVVSQGKNSRRIYQTVFFANDKNWYLPNFQLKPENWWHKLKKNLGLDKDIDFEENNEFSERFWLKSEFEDIVRQQFTPELQQFMLEKPPVHLEGENYYLTAYKPGKRLKADEARHFYENCCELVKLLKTEGKMSLLQLADIKKEPALLEVPTKPVQE